MMPMRFLPLTANKNCFCESCSAPMALPFSFQIGKWGGQALHAIWFVVPCGLGRDVQIGHNASNTPDLFRPPKLSGAGPG